MRWWTGVVRRIQKQEKLARFGFSSVIVVAGSSRRCCDCDRQKVPSMKYGVRNGGIDSPHPTPNEMSSITKVQPAISQKVTQEVVELDWFDGVAQGPDIVES